MSSGRTTVWETAKIWQMGKELNTEKLVLRIVKSLVDYPEDVQVSSIIQGTVTVFEVSVIEDDVGKVIGKSGRTARAIRDLLMAMSIVANTRYGLDIRTKCENEVAAM